MPTGRHSLAREPCTSLYVESIWAHISMTAWMFRPVLFYGEYNRTGRNIIAVMLKYCFETYPLGGFSDHL